jgi:hypothetical protein
MKIALLILIVAQVAHAMFSKETSPAFEDTELAIARLDEKVEKILGQFAFVPKNYGLNTPCKSYDTWYFTYKLCISPDHDVVVPCGDLKNNGATAFHFQENHLSMRGYQVVGFTGTGGTTVLQKCLEYYPRPEVPVDDLINYEQ